MGNIPAPTTAITTCLEDGFNLNSGLRIDGGSGCLLVAGEAFRWRPWQAGSRNETSGSWRALVNSMGQWEVSKEAWGLLELVWPKPGMYTFFVKMCQIRKGRACLRFVSTHFKTNLGHH